MPVPQTFVSIILTAGALASPTGPSQTPAQQRALVASINVTPRRHNHVNARLTPRIAGALAKDFFFFPGFRPICLVKAEGHVIASQPIPTTGEFEFTIPADVVAARSELQLTVHPSTWLDRQGAALVWGLEVQRVSAVDYVTRTFVVDVGEPGDMPYIGPGFSYQEGAQARPQAWAHDESFRWSRPGCRLRVPLVAGASHSLTLRGEVPIGFRVLADHQVIASFMKPNPDGAYRLEVPSPQTDGKAHLQLQITNIDPMPLPNLDLRELFWALNKVEVQARVPHSSRSFGSIPASGMADAAFRAALSGLNEEAGPLPIALKARWDLPAGYKTEIQLQQEILTILANGGTWSFLDDFDPPDAPWIAEQLLPPVRRMVSEVDRVFRDGQACADVAILVGRDQVAASRTMPGTRDLILEQARGAFRALQQRQWTVVLLSDADLAARARDFQCIIVPRTTFLQDPVWPLLDGYVTGGGRLIVAADLSAPWSDAAVHSLLGCKPKSYERGNFSIALPVESIAVYNADWQAMLALDGAQAWLPFYPAAANAAAPSPGPAVSLRDCGKGYVATVAFDVFGLFERYSNPQYARLLEHVLTKLGVTRSVEVGPSKFVVPTLSRNDDAMIVHLTNCARGHFDSGGLMNSSRTASFAADVPSSAALVVRIRLPGQLESLQLTPPDGAASWNFRDGLLNVTLSPIHLQRTLTIRLKPAATESSPGGASGGYRRR